MRHRFVSTAPVVGAAPLLLAPRVARTPRIDDLVLLEMAAPMALPVTDGVFVSVDVAAVEAVITSWAIPLIVYFRRRDGVWRLVDVERRPNGGRTCK